MVQCLELLIDWRRFVSGWLVMANTCHYWQMTGLWCSVWSWGTLDCCVADLWWPTLVTINRWRGYGAVFGAGETTTVVWLTCDGQNLSLLTDDGAMVQCLELGSHDCCVADLWWPTLVTIDRWRGNGAVFGAGEPTTVVWLTCDGQHCHYWQMTGLWCSVWSCWLIDGALLLISSEFVQ